MDRKMIGGALTALGIVGALLGLYLFQLSSSPPHSKRLDAALILGAVFVVAGLVIAFLPAKATVNATPSD
jgi:multisubunit Na+/H+ antiporter MnhB subunit